MLNKSKLFQAMIATGLIVGMNTAGAGLWVDADMKTELKPAQGTNAITTEGNAWLADHTYFSALNTVVTIGGSLGKTGTEGAAKLELYDHTTVKVSKDVVLDTLTNNGVMKVGGNVTVGVLEQHGTFTGIDGAPVGKVTAREFQNHVAGEYQDLTVLKTLTNTGVDLTMTGAVGSDENAATILTTGGNVVVNGAVRAKHIEMTNGNVTVNGTVEFAGTGWLQVVGTGKEKLEAKEIVVKANGTVYGSELKADKLTVDGTEAETLFTVSYTDQNYTQNPGKLNVGTLVLEGNVNFQHHDKQNPLEVDKIVLNTTSANYFQTYGGMKIATLEVGGDARIDGHTMPAGYLYDIPIEIGAVTVKKGASLTISNTVGTGKSPASIGTLVLEDGASLSNAAYKSDGTTLRLGYQLAIENIHAENTTIKTIDGTTTLGAEDGTVVFSGTVNDSGKGRTIINLNNAGAVFAATGASSFDTLGMKGGTADISQTEEDVQVDTLSGTGTVVMDAAGDNKLVAGNTTEGTKIVAKASETADDVTVEEAAGMVGRLEGVKEADKSGRVDEGMYNGAITVDGSGNATVKTNSLMADTLELASASTLSLNRILMNDVRKRLGNIRLSESAEGIEGVWARYDGGRLLGEGTKTRFHTIKAGGDTRLAAAPVRLGLSASYTTGDADATRGDADLDAWSLAAYGLWSAENGAFADVVARVGRAEADMTVDGRYKGSLENTAWSLSGEFGWHLDLAGGLYAEPQVEATYTRIESDSMTLSGAGATYSYEVDALDSMIGRLGGLVGMKCPNNKGDVYVRASLVHEFMGDAAIRGANGAVLESDGKDTWVEYGVGASLTLTPATWLWLDLERTSGASVDEDVRATVGIRHAF